MLDMFRGPEFLQIVHKLPHALSDALQHRRKRTGCVGYIDWRYSIHARRKPMEGVGIAIADAQSCTSIHADGPESFRLHHQIDGFEFAPWFDVNGFAHGRETRRDSLDHVRSRRKIWEDCLIVRVCPMSGDFRPGG